jgi:hypothetical protein
MISCDQFCAIEASDFERRLQLVESRDASRP